MKSFYIMLMLFTVSACASRPHREFKSNNDMVREWYQNRPEQWKEWDKKYPYDGKAMVDIYDSEGRKVGFAVEK